ncbi:MAG: exosome complex exonuclease Rrp41 [Nanoarchaeota archaeon]|nr:exosome complex exonuclease Rrp41 [Nanoarchaeota archaeon]
MVPTRRNNKMGYDKRYDGREFDEVRPITAKAGVVKNADGSAYFRIGGTWAYAAVYGPREMFPRFQQNPKKGVLRVNYNMMPFSGQGDRVRPGPNRRAKELSMVSTKAFQDVVDLSKFPNAAVDVFIELPETDAGSRCAGICAASIALADAGIVMKDMVAAVAVGRVDDQIVVDLSYLEEATEDGRGAVDIATAMIPSTGEFTLLQMDGVITKDELKEALSKAKDACAKIAQVQRQALHDKYGNQGGDDNE